MRQAFGLQSSKVSSAYGELANNKKAAQITRDDLIVWRQAHWFQLLHSRSGLCGSDQGPTVHRSRQAKMTEGAVRDHFDNWLAGEHQSLLVPSSTSLSFARKNVCAAETGKRDGPEERRQKNCVYPESWWTATQSGPRTAPSCSSWRVTARAAPPKWHATARTQALLPLRGKILNVLGAASSKLTGRTQKSSDL